MKSKKILTAVLCFCMTAQICGYSTTPFRTNAEEYYAEVEMPVTPQNYDIYLYMNLGNYIKITAVSTMATGEIKVPTEIDGLPVKIIDEHAFAGLKDVTEISLPDTVTSIGKQAFLQCTSLKSVNLPSGIKKIEDETFLSCTSLEQISLPQAVKSIGVRAFWGCSSLKSITIPPSVTSIGEQAFEGCGISTVNIPYGVTTIESNTFNGCNNLSRIVLPQSVNKIGMNAFPSGLEFLAIANGNCEIHDFAIPSKATTIEVPSGSAADFLIEHGYINLVSYGDGTVYYDVNGDGAFGVSDVVALQSYILGKSAEINRSYADMNGDGRVDVFDLCLMKKYLVEESSLVISPLPLATSVNLTAELESQAVEGLESDEEFITGQTEFALNLLKESIADDKGNNVLISPYSVMQALALTGNGADGSTQTEMENVLGGVAFENLNRYLYTLRTNQPNTDKCKLMTANSVWSRDDDERIKVESDFLQKAVDYYGADVFKAPFDDTTVTDINSWIDNNTDHMIDKVIDDISPETVMFLINAVTFDAKWQVPYNNEYDVRSYNFTDSNGNIQEAEMMMSDEGYYISDENAKGFIKYYEGGRYAFATLLPDESMTVEEYIDTLTPESLHNILANPESAYVWAGLPKFSYDYEKELSDSLSDMGMPTAFTPSANFTKLAKTSSGLLFIDFVLHKTHIEVDNEGTRAAAVTVIEATNCCIPEHPKEVILDRPFLYCILDTETSLPVFIGTLNTLE